MKKILTSILLISIINSMFSQTTVVSNQNTMIKSNHNFGLSNSMYDEGSPMTYNIDPAIINVKGAAFSFNYTNQDGESNFDGYPSGSVGAFKTGGKYYPANFMACGMPVQLQNLENDLRIKWKTFQIDANDISDKWWATINVIFDGGLANNEPIDEDRDYDLVIQFERFEQDELEDKANTGYGSYYWFARDSINEIVPFSLMIDGMEYQWAVRYKFFEYPVGDPNEHKNNKVHIKFIPADNNNIPPELDHPLKIFVEATVNYIQHLELPSGEATLVDQKVADPNLWVKSISAGYEVYSGVSTLGQEHFYSVVDTLLPSAPTNLSALWQNNKVILNWDAFTEDSYESYNVFRAENESAFSLLCSSVYQNNYTDTSIVNGEYYQYYVTVLDRSFNESSKSNTESLTILSISSEVLETINLYPNPVSDILHFNIDSAIKNVEIYSISGIKQAVLIDNKGINMTSLRSGLYFIKINNNTFKIIKK